MKWRRPKGLHSKLRLNIRGKLKNVSQGYRSPKKIRGLHKSGLEVIRVASSKELIELDAKKHGIVISSTVGKKKRVDILKKAKELNFNVLNIKDPEGYIKDAEQKMAAKKKEMKEGTKPVKEAEKKDENLAEKLDEPGKKEGEKKEKDRLLTKRER